MKRTFLLGVLFLLMIPVCAQELGIKKVQYKAGYQIEGTLVKKSFLANHRTTVSWNDGSYLTGILFYEGGRTIINGEYRNEREIINGTFSIWNNTKGRLALKSNRPLEWEPLTVSSYSLSRNSNQIELTCSGNDAHLVFDLSSTESNVESLESDISAELIRKYGYYAVDSLLIKSDTIQVAYADGQLFKGKASLSEGYEFPVLLSGSISCLPAKNIEAIHFEPFLSDSVRVNIFLDGNDKVKSVQYSCGSSVITKNGADVFDALLENASSIYGKAEMTQGRHFVGNFSCSLRGSQLLINLKNGTINYENGDSFVGNAGGPWFCNIPVDGTIYLQDGTAKVGDWISPLKLSNYDKEALSLLYTPSEFIEEAQIMNANNVKTKTFSGRILEGPYGYYYSGHPLEAEEGTGKYTYYLDDGDKILHGAYNFRTYIYLSAVGKDQVSVTGQHYNGDRIGEWKLMHKDGQGTIRADLTEQYNEGVLNGLFLYKFSVEEMKYTINGEYRSNNLVGNITITIKEGSRGFEIKGQFDSYGWADGPWVLKDRKTKKETIYNYNHGTLLNKNGTSAVSLKDIFFDKYEPLAQYKQITNGFK